MAQVRTPITQRELTLAVAEAGEGPFDLFVGGVGGLSLRRLARTPAWTLRGRVSGSTTVRTWTLGEWPGMSLDAARALAGGAMDRARRGENPGPWLVAMSGQTATRQKPARHQADDQAATRQPAPAAWSWEHGVAEYLRLGGATWRAATARHYRACLMLPAVVEAFPALDACTPDALREVRNTLLDAGKRVQANAVTVAVRAFLRWCSTRPESGYGSDALAALTAMRFRQGQAKDRPGDDPADRLPTEQQLGRLLWLLPGATAPMHARLGVALLALTGQRIGTLRLMHASEHVAGEWRIPGAHMKSGRASTLRLPPFTDALMSAMLRAAPAGPLVFPQARPSRSAAATDTRLAYASFRDACQHALGHTPHALRRALATHGERVLRLRRQDVEAVLDHADRSVVGQHYSVGEDVEAKAVVLAAWERHMLALALRHAPQGQAWPRYLPDLPT